MATLFVYLCIQDSFRAFILYESKEHKITDALYSKLYMRTPFIGLPPARGLREWYTAQPFASARGSRRDY